MLPSNSKIDFFLCGEKERNLRIVSLFVKVLQKGQWYKGL